MPFDLFRLQSSCTTEASNRARVGRHVLRYHATCTPVIIARYPISPGISSPVSSAGCLKILGTPPNSTGTESRAISGIGPSYRAYTSRDTGARAALSGSGLPWCRSEQVKRHRHSSMPRCCVICGTDVGDSAVMVDDRPVCVQCNAHVHGPATNPWDHPAWTDF